MVNNSEVIPISLTQLRSPETGIPEVSKPILPVAHASEQRRFEDHCHIVPCVFTPVLASIEELFLAGQPSNWR